MATQTVNNNSAPMEKDIHANNMPPPTTNGHHHNEFAPHAAAPRPWVGDRDTEGYSRPFGGALQAGHWRPQEHRKFANPAPLGLSAFALTTFVLSCVNMHARGVKAPNIAVPVAFGYGGLVQLLAGMW
jgi:hypothetical protein